MSLTDKIIEAHDEWERLQKEYEAIMYVSTTGENAYVRREVSREEYERSREIVKRQREISKTITEVINNKAERNEQAMEPSQYPEHEKMHKFSQDSQRIGAFLDWLQNEEGVVLCRVEKPRHQQEGYYPINLRIEEVLADYFDIDLDKIEAEKEAMLEALRAANREASQEEPA